MELRLLREEGLGTWGFKALFILAVFKKKMRNIFIQKGSHFKSYFIILNMSL